MKLLAALPAIALLVSGCAVSPKKFYENPSKQDVTSLCRAVFETTDPQFQRDVAAELIRRGMSEEDCKTKINQQNTAIAAVAVVGAVATVGVLAANGGGGGYAPSAGSDYDCLGGGGNGPYYVKGPFVLTGPDIYDLDRDGDGIACEPYDDMGA